MAVVVPATEGRAAGSLPFLVGVCVLLLLLVWVVGLVRAVSARAARERVAAGVAAEQARHAIAVEEERARIARDMHDVVAHSLTVMIAQAEGARLVAEIRGGASPEALTTIAETGRSALDEVRGLLTALRSADRVTHQPSLARMDGLISQVRDSGVDVVLISQGDPGALTPRVDAAAFRVLQEALTNAVRHGRKDAGPIEVHSVWTPTVLTMTIQNPTAQETRGDGGTRGHGLIGMQERAAHVGGTLQADFDGDARFTVWAVLPLSQREPS